nr:CCA tRNA nucleotidyltransferase [Spirochaeta sp.]
MHVVPAPVRRMAQQFHDAGHEIYVVGGAVRDALLGLPVADYDFATSATPEEVQRLFRRTIPTGIQHGTVTVLFEKHQFEVTTFRIDGQYSDHRRPEAVSFTRSLQEDLQRRDFTVNAIALDPATGEIVDPLNGRADLKEKTIRTVGDPRARFEEDALRMLRAVRFSVTLDFEIEAETIRGIRTLAPTLAHVAPERIRQELEKMMSAPRPSRGWRALDAYGLLGVIAPELTEDRNRVHDTPEMPDVFSHLLQSCDCAPADDPILRWAALLHD